MQGHLYLGNGSRRFACIEKDHMIEILLSCLVPVCFCVAIGWLAGWFQILGTEKVRALSTYVVVFALPALLFAGVFKFSVSQLSQWQNLVTLIAALLGTWVIA
jgi:predicted permease